MGHSHSQRLALGRDSFRRQRGGVVASELRGQRPRGHRTKWFLKKGAAARPDAAKWSSAWGMGLTYALAPVQVVIVSGSLEVGGGFGRSEEVSAQGRFSLADSL